MSAPTSASHTLTDSEFHARSHAVLAAIEATLDRWLQDDVIDIDSHRTGGLLELDIPGGGKIALVNAGGWVVFVSKPARAWTGGFPRSEPLTLFPPSNALPRAPPFFS